MLKLVYELRNLEKVVIYNTVYQFETDFIINDYFKKEFDDFLEIWVKSVKLIFI